MLINTVNNIIKDASDTKDSNFAFLERQEAKERKRVEDLKQAIGGYVRKEISVIIWVGRIIYLYISRIMNLYKDSDFIIVNVLNMITLYFNDLSYVLHIIVV